MQGNQYTQNNQRDCELLDGKTQPFTAFQRADIGDANFTGLLPLRRRAITIQISKVNEINCHDSYSAATATLSTKEGSSTCFRNAVTSMR
jgi:hypothetical protein